MSATLKLFKKIKKPLSAKILKSAKSEVENRKDRRHLHIIRISQRDKYGSKFAFNAFYSGDEFGNAMKLAKAEANLEIYSDLEFVLSRQLLINFNSQNSNNLTNSGPENKYIECLVLLDILIPQYASDLDGSSARDSHIRNLLAYLGIPESIMDDFQGESMAVRLTDALSMNLDLLATKDLKRIGTAQEAQPAEIDPSDEGSSLMREAESEVMREFQSIIDKTRP